MQKNQRHKRKENEMKQSFTFHATTTEDPSEHTIYVPAPDGLYSTFRSRIHCSGKRMTAFDDKTKTCHVVKRVCMMTHKNPIYISIRKEI